MDHSAAWISQPWCHPTCCHFNRRPCSERSCSTLLVSSDEAWRQLHKATGVSIADERIVCTMKKHIHYTRVLCTTFYAHKRVVFSFVFSPSCDQCNDVEKTVLEIGSSPWCHMSPAPRDAETPGFDCSRYTSRFWRSRALCPSPAIRLG